MLRRDALATVAMLASPCLGLAATASVRNFRIGVLSPADAQAEPWAWNAFTAELARQGFVVGRNLAIERQSWRGTGADAAAAALVARGPDVIYAEGGTQAAVAARRATSSIPIVFQSADPVAFGLVASLAHPEANLTGVSIQGPVITTKELQYMAEALGGLKSMTYLQPMGTRSLPWYPRYVAAATSAATVLGTHVEFLDVPRPDDYEPLIRSLADRGVSAAAVMDGGSAVSPSAADYERIAALFLRHRVPAIGPTDLGFLLKCYFDAELIAQRIAYLVGRILLGAKPSELPVEEFSVLRLSLNVRTAQLLGLQMPRSLLVRADEVRS